MSETTDIQKKTKTKTKTNQNPISSELHASHYNVLLDWAKTSPSIRNPRVVFLYGPPGVGKTTLAHRVMNDAGLRTVECNASQFRHKAAMSELIEPLLESTNVADYFRPEGHRALGIILDEIDGMSAGDRGGLTELIRILKEYKGDNAIICISNEWIENRYKPLISLSLCIQIMPPTVSECSLWLHREQTDIRPLWTRHQGDLRKLQQWECESNNITRSMTVEDLVLRILTGKMIIQEDLNLDNNDLNLAGLHLHETLPNWIREHHGSNTAGWKLYYECLKLISTSDRHDYFTFFHQHWSLFPLSFQSKLHAVNYQLFTLHRPAKLIPPIVAPAIKGWKIQYTSVLSRQSWLFNQFKYLCELRDLLQGSPLRDGGLELALWTASLLNTQTHSNSVDILCKTGTLLTHVPEKPIPKDRIKRWLKTLAVPEITPCPIGKKRTE